MIAKRSELRNDFDTAKPLAIVDQHGAQYQIDILHDEWALDTDYPADSMRPAADIHQSALHKGQFRSRTGSVEIAPPSG